MIPVIDSQPNDSRVTVGQTAIFHIHARGAIASYDWQKSNDNGATWHDTSGTTATFSFVTGAMDTGASKQYRCIVVGSCSGANGNDTSQIARIGLCFPVSIQTSPQSDTVMVGNQALYSVGAIGTGLTYQWEKDTVGTGAWVAIPAAKNSTYGFNVTAANNGWRFHCKVNDSCNTTAVSGVATLSVCTPGSISADPKDTTVYVGANVSFKVAAVGSALTYKWQKSPDGTSWANLTGASASTATFTMAADTASAGAQFRCLVTGGCGPSVTSKSAKLTVCFPFTIPSAGQPADQINIAPGQQAVFHVTTNGLNLSYQWKRSADAGVTWTPITTGGTTKDYSLLVTAADNNTKFECAVTSPCTTLTSAAANLTVCGTPVIVIQPATNNSAIVGKGVQFSISATGSNLAYQWQRMNSGDSTWDSIPGAVDTVYMVPVTKLSDSGASFQCVVHGKCGTVMSKPAQLAVYSRAVANFSMKVDGAVNNIAPAPATVTFTDSSLGNITSLIWSYGYGKNDTVSGKGAIEFHTFDSTGVYNVKLFVQGPGGVDSIVRTLTVYSKTGNPIILTGRYRPQDSAVLLEYKNFGSLNAGPLPPPAVTVDSIMLWYLPGGMPDSTHKNFRKKYQLATLKNAGAVFDDTLKVDMLNTYASTCGFMTQIAWNTGKFSSFDSVNGYMVIMRDTLRPVNRLAVSGSYTPWDTVTFFLDSVQTIDTLADSVALWYGIGADSLPDFSNHANPNVKWWKAADVVKGATNNRFAYMKQNVQFNTDPGTLTCAVEILGKNKLSSLIKSGKVAFGRTRPINQLILHAVADTGASSIINVTWNHYSVADSIEKIRIYFRSGGAIPLQADFSGISPLDSLVIVPANLGDTARAVHNLNPSTRYYFGAQIYKKGMWSLVTILSSANDSTSAQVGKKSTIRNTITITSAVFDSTTNMLHITWTVDTTVAQYLYIGYSYSTTAGNPLSTTVRSIADKVLASDTGSVNIVFKQNYYVYLWLEKQGENWALPTDSSTAMVSTSGFTWQSVHYNFTLLGETSYWVNGQIRFVTPPSQSAGQIISLSGKIGAFTDTVTDLAGFIKVGQSFVFIPGSYQQPQLPFQIALKVTLPAGRNYKLNDVFVYRFDATSGKWWIDRTTQRDTVNNFVYVNTSPGQLGMPMAALIDTQPPQLTPVNPSTAPVSATASLTNTIAISDNVGNIKWTFLSAKGGDKLAVDTTDTLTKGFDTVGKKIPSAHITADNGVVASFIVDDGRNSKAVDLSRQVIRAQSDPESTPVMNWFPLRVTAVLKNPAAKQLLKFIDTTSKTPTYDNRYVRLFRWHPDSLNITNTDHWREYTQAPDSVFDFISGRLMWIKTRKAVSLNFDSAVTMPQTVPVVVPLFDNNQYTDFASPYLYDMCIGDIIKATGDTCDTCAKGLRFNAWVNTNGKYSFQVFFDPTLGKVDSSSVLPYLQNSIGGFSVLNPTGKMVKLVFPPISTSLSKYASTKPVNAKRAVTGGTGLWAVKVLPKTADSSVLSAVYCGYTPKRSDSKIVYPVSPSFDGTGVCVYDAKTGVLCGHKMLGDITDGGCSYLLAFNNGLPTAQTLSIALERTGAIPSTMKTAVFNIQTGELAMVAPGATATVSVPVEGNSREYRWLFVGDAHYISSAARLNASAKLALTSVYPNPVRRFAHLLYTLPFGTVASVDFTVLDIMGRTVWHKNIKEQSIFGGRRDYVWYGTGETGRRVAAGVYVLRMTANDPKGKNVGAIDRRITVIP
jgi:PKD repeat protein